NEIYSMKDLDLRFAANCKFRSMYPPVEYDAKGRLKKWTQKELAALKGNSKLRGYPIELDSVRAGQTVDIYLAKKIDVGASPKGKKKTDDDDIGVGRPEAVMIVITLEAPAPK